MPLPKTLLSLLWQAAGCAALVLTALWLVDTETGKVSAWALLLLFWGAAVVAMLAHQVTQWRDPIGRYLARHKPLSGPRPGAELPG